MEDVDNIRPRVGDEKHYFFFLFLVIFNIIDARIDILQTWEWASETSEAECFIKTLCWWVKADDILNFYVHIQTKYTMDSVSVSKTVTYTINGDGCVHILSEQWQMEMQ